jgi:hypothetical protein
MYEWVCLPDIEEGDEAEILAGISQQSDKNRSPRNAGDE